MQFTCARREQKKQQPTAAASLSKLDFITPKILEAIVER